MFDNFTALVEWAFGAVSDFVMAEPMCYVFGLFLLGFVISLIGRLAKI